jgi:hypothetical protein
VKENQVTEVYVNSLGQELPELFGVIINDTKTYFSTFQANISLATALCVKLGITEYGPCRRCCIVSGHNLGTAPIEDAINDTSGC